MSFDNGQDGSVAVGGTATLIVELVGNGNTVAVKNIDGTDTVYLGGSDVTTSDGYPLDAGEGIGIAGDDGDDLYGITAGGSAEVRVLRQGV